MPRSSLHFPDAHAFLAGTRPRDYRGRVYVIGGRGERRVTLYAQQCRALNIVAALSETGWSGRIAVIGAGSAGLVAAVALSRLGADVTVVDRAAAPLHPQRASYTRFLHPRLFHWPESGWDNDDADLPIGTWRAGYADAVREQILSSLGDVEIEYCTEAVDVLDADAPLVRTRRLGRHEVRERRFGTVLVATGFPSERPAPGALGGSYWHAVEGLDLLTAPSVRVAGDGDGALTEVLLLFIDRIGHRGVEALVRLISEHERLREADFAAQGRPDANADPPLECRSHELMERLRLLDDGQTRVTIHADRALKGKSFLINRILVSHLRWLDRSPVDVVPQNLTSGTHPSGDPVIWRVGLFGTMPARRFEIARLSTAHVLEQLDGEDAVAAGLLTQTVDALRRPLWSTTFAECLDTGASPWSAVGPGRLDRAHGAVAAGAQAALPDIAATYRCLLRLGVPLRADAVAGRGEDGPVTSIETVVRVTSIPHAECVAPTAGVSERVLTDELGRLWFPLDPRPAGEPTRAATLALTQPGPWLERWAESGRAARTLDEAPLAVLRGLADMGADDHYLHRLLYRLHRDAGRWSDAIAVRLRAARVPEVAGETPVAIRVRDALLDIADVLSRSDGAGPYFRPGDLWLLLAAAGSQLRTVATDRTLFVSESFLIEDWAPRVRAIGERADGPDWFARFAAIAREMPSDRGALLELVRLLTYATAEAKTPEEGRRAPIARFGVWLDVDGRRIRVAPRPLSSD